MYNEANEPNDYILVFKLDILHLELKKHQWSLFLDNVLDLQSGMHGLFLNWWKFARSDPSETKQ